MSHEKFVYVTYIAASPEQIWAALLKSELTKRYWGHENVCDGNWEKGDQWRHIADDEKHTVKLVGEVLEVELHKRLVLSWISPERLPDPTKHTRVEIKLEPAGEMVRLTVIHDQLYPEMHAGISKGWPWVLSRLKSFVELGHAPKASLPC